MTCRLLGCLLLLWCHAASAAEIASNGVGGGAWTDPATWRAKKTPAPEDDVVIQKNDVVIFDRADDGKPSCRKLLIDPRGGLAFKTGAGKLVLAVEGGIESFGAIRLDGTKSAGDDFELRLVGDTVAKRLVKIAKGGALLLYGRANLADGKRNVAIVSPPDKEPILATVEAEGMVMIDWQRARVADVKLAATKIDNTGARPNERLKMVDNEFTGLARFYCTGCDTPEVVRNRFDNRKGKPVAEPAINVHNTQLPDIKSNAVHGPFTTGIAINIAVDAVLTGNTIDNCGIGIQGGYGVPNLMLKQLTIRGCESGIKLEGATGVLEDVTVDGSLTAYYQTNCRLQLHQFRVKNLAKKGVAVSFDTGTLSLLNCDIQPDDVKIAPQKPAAKAPPEIVTSLQYVVVSVTGAPAGALVEIRTAKPAIPAGAADPNVRNSPAALVDGRTPLPRALTPLIVKAWSFDLHGKPLPPPEYTVQVLGPMAKEGAVRPVLKAQPFRPAPRAYREPDDKTPTLEVRLK